MYLTAFGTQICHIHNLYMYLIVLVKYYHQYKYFLCFVGTVCSLPVRATTLTHKFIS